MKDDKNKNKINIEKNNENMKISKFSIGKKRRRNRRKKIRIKKISTLVRIKKIFSENNNMDLMNLMKIKFISLKNHN